VSLYSGVDEVTPITDTETKTAAEQCLRFSGKVRREGRLPKTMDESDDAYAFAITIQIANANLDPDSGFTYSRIGKRRAKNFKPREVSGKTVKLEVMGH